MRLSVRYRYCRMKYRHLERWVYRSTDFHVFVFTIIVLIIYLSYRRNSDLTIKWLLFLSIILPFAYTLILNDRLKKIKVVEIRKSGEYKKEKYQDRRQQLIEYHASFEQVKIEEYKDQEMQIVTPSKMKIAKKKIEAKKGEIIHDPEDAYLEIINSN